MRHYPQGQTIALICSFTNESGPVDPTNLRAEAELDGVQTTYEYPGDIQRVAAGSYLLDVLPAGAGVLTYRWIGDGVATPDIQVRILESRLT